MDALTPCVWFDADAEEAVRLWTALVPDSRVTSVSRRPGADDGPPLFIEFTLMGRPFAALNGGPGHPLGQAVSLMVPCQTQAEIDRLWDGLLEGGGQEQACGWLKDRFGQSWQIVPTRMMDILRDGEPEGRARAFEAMLAMVKYDLAAIERAYAGEG
jgi:predicted 3-demethylubiquinone-9 3-methyltransferase (glyoxalase superfamily)